MRTAAGSCGWPGMTVGLTGRGEEVGETTGVTGATVGAPGGRVDVAGDFVAEAAAATEVAVGARVGLAAGVAVSTPNCKASQPDSSKAAARQSEMIGLGAFMAAIPPVR